MQEIGVGSFVVFPSFAIGIEKTATIRRLTLFRTTPDIKGIKRIIPGSTGLPEPLMLIAGMIDHHVHDDPQTFRMAPGNKRVEIGDGPVYGIDVIEIADIISVVMIRGSIYGIDPKRIDAQRNDIIQLLQDTSQITYPIPVAVFKAAGIDLVDDRFFPPLVRWVLG